MRDLRLRVKKATDSEALREADFRNVSFLHKFTSEAGALPPRRVTRLQKKVHVHVMKQIKVSNAALCCLVFPRLAHLHPGKFWDVRFWHSVVDC